MSTPKTWSPRRVIATAGIAAVAVSLAFAVPQVLSGRRAQQQANLSNRMMERGIAYGQRDALEAYREQYLTVLMNLQEVSTIYGGAPAENELALASERARARQGIEIVRGLTAEELSVMMELTPDLSSLLYATEDLVNIARADRQEQLSLTAGGVGRVAIGTPGGDTWESGGFPSAPYSSEVGGTRPSTAATLAASATFETAETVRETASRGCDETIVAIGAGGNTSLVCIAADVVWIAAKIVFWDIQFQTADIDSAEILGIYNRAGHLHTDLETLQSTLGTHDSNIDTDLANHNTNIENRIANHDANIDSDLAAHDSNIDSDLAAHDANIDADLAAHDANIDGDLMTHDIEVQAQLGGIQGTLDHEIEKQRVHMQVMSVVNRSRYLVLTSEAGLPVDVSFGDVEAYNAVTRSFEKLNGTTITQIETGIYELGMYLGPFSAAKIFRLNVTHDDVVDHFGQIVFHRDTL